MWTFAGAWRRLKHEIEKYYQEFYCLEFLFCCFVLPPLCLVIAASDFVKNKRRLRRDRARGEREERRRRAKRAEERRNERDGIRPLPATRPRALTLQSGDAPAAFKELVRGRDEVHVLQRTVDQLGVCDLWRFPLEVREIIWRHCLGYNHIHIVKRRGRLGSVYCPARDPTDPVHRDLCVRRDRRGIYIRSSWPRDMRPLALLLSCRQIYSESVGFLYSHNTFAFDDPALLSPFLASLLPRRSQLIASFHFAPMFGTDQDCRGPVPLHHPPVSEFDMHAPDASQDASLQNVSFTGSRCAYPNLADLILRTLKESHTAQHLGKALNILAAQPTLHSLTVTPKLRRNFEATGTTALRNFIPLFIHALNKMRASTPIVLAWPEDPREHTPVTMLNLNSYWGRDEYLPPREFRTLEIRKIPYQSPILFMTFFTPFDVQCLHCSSYTLIRRTTKGHAEVSFLPLSLSSTPVVHPALSDVLVRYWTFHSFCGGWIEFQYHGARKEWSVTQGAQRVSNEDADRHVAGLSEAERRAGKYPEMENAHEKLRGVNSLMAADAHAWQPFASPLGLDRSTCVDEPTRDAFYRNMGWRKE